MPGRSATAISHPNIAFIKYWGNRNAELRIPANGSISLTLDGLQTTTTVQFDPGLELDQVSINDQPADPEPSDRITTHLDRIRALAKINTFAHVNSSNSFPSGAGIASSASAFAALTVAACAAASLELNPSELSRLARKGSGSAARSIFGGFVELSTGDTDEQACAHQIAPADHWDLIDVIAVIDTKHKLTGSTSGHSLAGSSPLQAARIEDAPRRLELCRRAIIDRDFEALTTISELDSNMMHAIMMTSAPPLLYWLPGTLDIIHTIVDLRSQGVPVFYTIDAGPNVHCICENQAMDDVISTIQALSAVQYTLKASAGTETRLRG